ncbi:MAG: hypothetical protein ACI39R_01250 [Lachnospiraceae bacterium]
MKNILKRSVAVIITVITLLCVLPLGEIKASAASVEYKELQRYENQEITVKATSNYYFDKCKISSSSYVADCIPKGTKIGSICFSVITSQSAKSNSGTVFGNTDYGKTWGDAVSIGITMKPRSSISLQQYIASDFSMSDAKVWGAGSTSTYYVGSEDLYNYIQITSPNTSYGYLSNWSPNYVEDTSGWETHSFGLTISTEGVNFTSGLKLNITDEFVNGHDYSNQSTGLYKTRYDYKKYNGIGYCSSDRRKKIFGNTSVYNGLEYRAVKSSLNISRNMYVSGTFTVCDSKTWPTEIKGFSGSRSAVINF